MEKIFGPLSEQIYTSPQPITLNHFINEKWVSASEFQKSNFFVPCPLTSEPMVEHPEEVNQIFFDEIKESMKKCPKSGMHNPFKNPGRYRGWGEILTRVVEELNDPDVHKHMANII